MEFVRFVRKIMNVVVCAVRKLLAVVLRGTYRDTSHSISLKLKIHDYSTLIPLL